MVFVVIEGIDGSGKSTQVRMLCERLAAEGRNVIQTKEPTDGPIGTLAKSMLKDRAPFYGLTLQLLFAADRSEHMKGLKSAVASRSAVVVSDRYYHSTIAFGEALGINREYLEKINAAFPKPDIAFVLDIGVEEALRRISARTKPGALERREIMRKAYRSYRKFTGVVFVDAERSRERISDELFKRVKKLV